MRRRFLLTLPLSLALLPGCGYPQYFDVSWNEEVKLHDGRVIVVKLKFTYERHSPTHEYDRAKLRDTELTFDAGPPHGQVTQVFKRVKPVMLDTVGGDWYVALDGRGVGEVRFPGAQDWGPPYSAYGERVAKLGATGFEPISIDAVPAQLKVKNLMYDYAPVEELVALEGKTLDLKFKASYAARFNFDPVDVYLRRPTRIPSARPTN